MNLYKKCTAKPYSSLLIDTTLASDNPKMMKKLYCIICGRYRKFEKPKISHLLENISSFYYLQ